MSTSPVHDKEFEHVTLLEDEYVLVVRAGSRTLSPALRELASMTHEGRGFAGAIVGRALYEGRFTIEEGIAACSQPA